MPLWDAIILGVIVSVFATFGIVLGAVCFYCRDRNGTARVSRRRPTAGYPTGGDLIIDHD
jgi:hypothetical protein